jgi:iron complex outermembrane receptor protein
MRAAQSCGLGLAIAAIGPGPGGRLEAQTQLPTITVTTPSPVAKKRPRADAGQGQAAPQPQPEEPAPAAPGVEDAFVAVTVVPESEIAATPGANLADALDAKPGIAGSTFAPGANRPVIRGLDNYRVRVQENGIGSHDVSALSEDHAVPIDPFAADRIEVVRGPATLRYGSQAIGGVVNAINGRIPEIVPPRGFSIETRGGSTSVDNGADGAFKVTAGAGQFAVHADAFRRHAGDYDTPRGREPNTFVDNEGFSVGASYVGRDGFIGLAFTRTDALYGIPAAESRIDMGQDKIQSKGEWRVRDFGIEAIRYWFGASDYAHSEIAFEGGAAEIGSRFTNREQEGRVEIEHRPVVTRLGELRGAVGTQIGHRDVKAQSFEGASLLEPATTDSIAAFWFEELQVSRRLRLQAAARIEHVTVEGVGASDPADPAGSDIAAERTFVPFSASAAALYELPLGIVARLTAQYVERAPADAELFSKGLHEATGTFEIGNPFLGKEAAKTIEVGLKRTRGTTRFDAAAYYTKFDGFIFKQVDGTCNPDGACPAPVGDEELKRVLFQQRNATFYGLELQGEQDVARIWRGIWGIDVRYDFVHATFDDAAGGNVPRIPPHRAGAGLYYRDPGWFARVGFLHAFDQNRVGDNETSTKGYTLLDAEVARTLKLGGGGGFGPEMTVGLKAENLLDDDVRNHVSFKKDEVLQPGRTIRLFGIVRLN